MKVNREMVARSGLKLLNEVGLDQLTLRRLAVELKVQAPTIYWSFHKQAGLIEAGFSIRQTVVLLSTIYSYTLSFVMEEQAVFPTSGKRSPQYDIEKRNARLDPARFPLLRQAGPILFDRFDRRYKEGLELILTGAQAEQSGPK
jgi:AcrR family transcriptional regulator